MNEALWLKVKRAWEEGATHTQLVEEYGISRNTLKSRIRREGWKRSENAAPTPRKPPAKQSVVAYQHEMEEHLGNALTEEEQKFAQHFLEFHSPVKAYRFAFGKEPSNTNIPKQLLNKRAIRDYIQFLQVETSVTFAMRLETIVDRLTSMAFSDITDYVDDSLNVKPVSEWTGDSRNIQEIVRNNRGEVYIKLVDKISALKEIKEILKYVGTDELRELQKKKAELDIELMEEQLRLIKNPKEIGGAIIVNNTDEMRRIMEERMKNKVIEAEQVQ